MLLRAKNDVGQKAGRPCAGASGGPQLHALVVRSYVITVTMTQGVAHAKEKRFREAHFRFSNVVFLISKRGVYLGI